MKKQENNKEAERADESERHDLDAFKGKMAGKGNGKCHVCDGEGHFARDCPSTPPVSPTDIECHGCRGKGHRIAQCPTANPQLKSKGTGKGFGYGKGYGKGFKGKGKGKGYSGGYSGDTKGKGKGYGKGKGKSPLYEIDVMGTWGGEQNWGGDQSWGGSSEWYPEQAPTQQGPSYLRSLASMSEATPPPVPIAIVNRYKPIADPETIEAPITDFVVVRKRKLRSRKFVHSGFGIWNKCGSDCNCEHEALEDFPELPKPRVLQEDDVASSDTWDSEKEVSDLESFPGRDSED